MNTVFYINRWFFKDFFLRDKESLKHKAVIKNNGLHEPDKDLIPPKEY